ncbi:protein of unknown function DUF239 [Macleaya cordata]|uniref:Neprosin PEP catalytic domain-containing protein n=1 Tax=Macleaya cordata TaxID=56857 RepID=A0A200PSR4_MACCD|nr:protein of unknown function DUF239 [Macleaya cordata]
MYNLQTRIGDIFDCIDIYKQPAFDHPLLQNHKIQMEPDYIPEETINEADPSSNIKVAQTELELHSERCPLGTVPIRRTKKRDLINAKSLSKRIKPYTNKNSLSPWPNLHVCSIEPNSSESYYGGSAVISIYNPKVEADQFSTAQLWIQNGPVDVINSIEFGWAVYPILFNDNSTRLFGYWTADGYQKTGCFNMLCSGFVQVHPSVALGDAINHTSVYQGIQYAMDAMVYRDPQSGNWWLMMNLGKSEEFPKIGYWPKELFSHLASNASMIRYGGVVGADTNRPTPPMGNGYLPVCDDYDFNKACYMMKMKVVDGNARPIDFDPSKIRVKQDTIWSCYNLTFNGYVDKYIELAMRFGGPGGMCP